MGSRGSTNRRRFDEYASTEWRRRPADERVPFGLLLIDVDHSSPTTTPTALAGDELLRRIGETIRDCCRRPEDRRHAMAETNSRSFYRNTGGGLEAIGERLRQRYRI